MEGVGGTRARSVHAQGASAGREPPASKDAKRRRTIQRRSTFLATPVVKLLRQWTRTGIGASWWVGEEVMAIREEALAQPGRA